MPDNISGNNCGNFILFIYLTCINTTMRPSEDKTVIIIDASGLLEKFGSLILHLSEDFLASF